MTWFVITAVILTMLAIALLVFPLLKNQASTKITSQPTVDPHTASNLILLQESQKSLDEDYQAKLITKEHYELQQQDLEKRTLVEVVQMQSSAAKVSEFPKKWPFILVGVVPLMVLSLYLLLGNPGAINPPSDPQNDQILSMVKELEKKLKTDPTNATGWILLARSYTAMNRVSEAKDAYQKAIEFNPKNANVLADYADLIAFENKGINPEALKLINQALQLDSKNPKALALKGSAEFEAKQYAESIRYWKMAIDYLSPNDQQFAQALQGSIAEAQSQLRPSAQTPAPPLNTPSVSNSVANPTTSNSPKVVGQVTLNAQFAKQVSPTDTVFIYARAINGPRMPVAIIRITAKDLPYNFTLSDAQAMSPEISISKFKEFSVSARVSKSGNALPEKGDLIGLVTPVPIGANQVQIVINDVQP